MIFGTVGTHTQGFDRFVRALDSWAETASELVVIQTGTSAYEPRCAEWFSFDSPERIESLMQAARVIVTHAGAGSLLMALESCGTVVAIPRLASLGEHVDDHQIELCEALEAAGLIRVAKDGADLQSMLATSAERAGLPSQKFRAQLVASITKTIAGLLRDID